MSTHGIRPMLFGIAMMIGSGLIIVHPISGEARGWVPLATLGMVVGFVIVTLGFFIGILLDS